MLNMKPYQQQRLYTKKFSNARDLVEALSHAIELSGQDGEFLNVDFDSYGDKCVSQLELDALCLSDGSVVYNVTLHE